MKIKSILLSILLLVGALSLTSMDTAEKSVVFDNVVVTCGDWGLEVETEGQGERVICRYRTCWTATYNTAGVPISVVSNTIEQCY